MLHLLFNPSSLPYDHFFLACSGGVDSMAAADFFWRGKKNFTVAYFHHATPQADGMQCFVKSWCDEHKVAFVSGNLTTTRPKDQSPEEFWRNERYNWLSSFKQPVMTAHHLNDVAETWLFSSLHGNPKIINPVNGWIGRPFILNPKVHLEQWCIRHGVKWYDDMSNQDLRFPRNRIRHNILPQCLEVNPGLLKNLKKKVLNKYRQEAQHV